MKLSIIVVSWNVKAYLVACLESILRYPPSCAYEVIVVDNASADGTATDIRAQYPEVKVVANLDNAGFARANNQGAAIATGEYLFVLNPDTLFLSNTMGPLLAFMDGYPEVGACGPRVLNEDMSLQRSVRGFPTWGTAFARHTVLGKAGLFQRPLLYWRQLDFDYTAQSDADVLIGAALLIRRDVFERIGGFDERYFMYFEELDLCRRIKEVGFRVVYYPGAEVIHYAGKSSKQIPAKKRFMVFSSLVLYLRKNTPSGRAFILTILFRLLVVMDQLGEGVFYYIRYLLGVAFRSVSSQSRYAARYKPATEFMVRYAVRFLRGDKVV